MKTYTLNDLETLSGQVKDEIAKSSSLEQLEKIDSQYIGRKGEITLVLRSLSEQPIEYRREIGKAANVVSNELKALVEIKRKELEKAVLSEKLEKEKIDITLPPGKTQSAHFHPLVQVMYEIVDIFAAMGFQVATGPEIETDYYNFEALNMPQGHPARGMWDTLYLNIQSKQQGQCLLRTHTSPVQIRVMEKTKPPLRIVVPGKVFRHEASDATHGSIFHQIEGFAVDEGITFADLKGTLISFAKKMFGENVKVRFRPSYFPFTEPSAEMDISCAICQGAGCRVCKDNGWLEMLGCGMIHPNLFRAVGYDTEKYTGFAFGIGVDRFAMFKYGIDDLRLFYENDVRVLRQI